MLRHASEEWLRHNPALLCELDQPANPYSKVNRDRCYGTVPAQVDCDVQISVQVLARYKTSYARIYSRRQLTKGIPYGLFPLPMMMSTGPQPGPDYFS